MIAIVAAVLAMIAQDAAIEFNTIAQVKGRAVLSAILSPLTTLTKIAVTVLSTGPVILHGVTPHAVAVIFAVLVTDAFDGYVFTWLGRRIGSANEH